MTCLLDELVSRSTVGTYTLGGGIVERQSDLYLRIHSHSVSFADGGKGQSVTTKPIACKTLAVATSVERSRGY